MPRRRAWCLPAACEGWCVGATTRAPPAVGRSAGRSMWAAAATVAGRPTRWPRAAPPPGSLVIFTLFWKVGGSLAPSNLTNISCEPARSGCAAGLGAG